MRVCYFIAELKEGVGPTTTLSQLLRYGAGRWESEVVTPKLGPLDPAGPLVGVSHRSRYYYRSLLEERLRESQRAADILHMVNGMPYIPGAIRSGRPIIYTLMQPDPTWLFGGLRRVNRLALRAVENRWLLRRMTARVSVSRWVAEWYRTHLGVETIVIPDAFDLRVFSPEAARGPTIGSPGLLCVGEWDGYWGRKRTHELVRAMPAILTRFKAARLRLVGLGPESQRVLGEMARTLQVADFVDLWGTVSEGDLVRSYRSADVYVAPTLVEGFYRPIVEAFACGLPAVARDGRAIVDPVCLSAMNHVTASGGGRMYDGSDLGLVRAIGEVLEQHAEFAQNALTYASQFDGATVLPRFEVLYRDLVARYGAV